MRGLYRAESPNAFKLFETAKIKIGDKEEGRDSGLFSALRKQADYRKFS
jgi:hypothetical protein